MAQINQESGVEEAIKGEEKINELIPKIKTGLDAVKNGVTIHSPQINFLPLYTLLF